MHDVGNKGRCRNLCIATTILDNTVVGLVRGSCLISASLPAASRAATTPMGRAAIDKLARITEATDELTEKRGRIFEAYAKEQMSAEGYIEAGRAIDEGIVRLRREKEGLCRDSPKMPDRRVSWRPFNSFCATGRARFEACADLDAKRAFLRDHVERIVFDHGKVTILGSLPLQEPYRQLAISNRG